MPDELQEALERVNMGWDRDKARLTLGESMSTIQVAVRLAREAIDGQERHKEKIDDLVTSLADHIRNLQPITGSRNEGNITRQQANSILGTIDKILKTQDVGALVRMSLDLTNQSRIFIEMMSKIDQKYGEEDRKKEEDITEWLNSEQLMQVYEWIEQNKSYEHSG